MKGRNRTLRGSLDLVRALVAGDGLHVDELAGKVGIHRRTVYRTLRTLRDLGCPVQNARDGAHVVYWLRLADLLDWLMGLRGGPDRKA